VIAYWLLPIARWLRAITLNDFVVENKINLEKIKIKNVKIAIHVMKMNLVLPV